MTCQEFTEFLVPYGADELAPAQNELVKLHLDQCVRCRATYTDLLLTRRQLATLRDERYQPQLTERITRAMKREQQARKVARWAGWGARAAAAAVAGLLVVTLMRGQLPLQVSSTPAAPPPPGTTTFLVHDSRLLYVDTGRQSATAVTAGTQLITGGGSQFFLTDDKLMATLPAGGVTQIASGVSGRLIGVSPDGRAVWVSRQVDAERFAVDKVEVASGKVSYDSNPKPGKPARSTISPDGQELYLVTLLNDTFYLKVVNTQTLAVDSFYSLDGLDVTAVPLPGRDHSIYVIGRGRLVTIAKEQVTSSTARDLTPVATLGPRSGTAVIAKERGGVLLMDLESGAILRQTAGPRYGQITMSPDGAWLYAVSGKVLTVMEPEELGIAAQINL